jgi:hypothetical protein
LLQTAIIWHHPADLSDIPRLRCGRGGIRQISVPEAILAPACPIGQPR